MNGCRHLWETVAVEFTPPSRGISIKGATPELVERLNFGITNITQTCANCSKVRVVTAAGKASAPLGGTP